MNDFEKIEKEIARLATSDYVHLALHADRVSKTRSDYLTWLRTQELRGRELFACGITETYLEELENAET